MEGYLRFYIKFQGYTMAVVCILASILATLVIYQNNDMHYPLEEFYNYRFMGSSALVFGVCWLAVGVSMLYGIIKEVKVYLYPFAVMYMLDLFLMFLRDIVSIWTNRPWYEIILLNPVAGFVALYITLHIMLSLVALGKLFEQDPLALRGTNFVRFKTENRPGEFDPQEQLGDELSLVTE